MLHVAQISFFHDPRGREPEDLLAAWPSLVDVAECATQAGCHVSVIQASEHSRRVIHGGVSYDFLPFGRAVVASAERSGLFELVRELAPNVIHVHGLGFPSDVVSLAAVDPEMPIILQDHANRVPRLWRRRAWRRGFSVAAGVAFCAAEQARPFIAAGLLRGGIRVYEVPESSSRFTPGDMKVARRELGVEGNPLLAWVGHLDENKDPLTVLDGVSRAAQRLPGLKLCCCFGKAPLLERVRHKIATDPLLRDRVHLLGTLPHEKIELLMRAADLFVSGSHREGSGYSLLEAMACGLPPVVTDIPSFRSLTGEGTVGALWPVGDAQELSQAVCSLAQRSPSQTRAIVRAYFERELSFRAVGMKLSQVYTDVLDRKLERSARAERVKTS